MRILLTGSSGYIGSRLIEPLRGGGHHVRGFDRTPPPAGYTPDEFCRGDLLDAELRRDALDGVDCILHLAASRADWGISEDEYFRDNTEATRALLADAEWRGVRRWIFFSSVSAMGPSEDGRSEDSNLEPIVPYGRSKAEAERMLERFVDDHPDAAVTTLRPSVVYGPGNPEDTNVYRLIDALHRRRFIMVGDGETRKTTSYIGNVVAATMFLLDRLDRGLDVYIYVDEPVLTTGEMIEEICSFLGRDSPSLRVPLGIAAPIAYAADWAAAISGTDFPVTSDRIQKFCRPTHFDGSAIRRAGFRQPARNREALRRTVDWYLQEHADGRS